ncbi:Crp/Fnr family transcriptional regulator [uncultured Polaribacter sp.]|uniref:Crp/Fnr family transcriptional regulator n=1 Tax=uncultured Polaribacter sp. TaxID=174711 RepID=UPI002634CE96|nr:Crp/Fnr family transcriptional regulator [uncultured Polaribacter sp.]
MEDIKKQLSFLKPALVAVLLENSTLANFEKGTKILRFEQYVKVLPIVISGLVKVFAKFEEKELLLYYIQPNQSCVMSFTAGLKNSTSKIFAVTEEESKILLIPFQKIPQLLKEYPEFNNLFYAEYDLRYSDLLGTLEDVLVNKLDKRLIDYLTNKAKFTNTKQLKLTHLEIAKELGTSREVVSRVIKKLENEGFLSQKNKVIYLHA